MLHHITKTDDSFAAVILRLTLAVVIWPHGAQKMLGLFGGTGFDMTMMYFTDQLGLPWIIAFLVILIEFFGPLMLIIGLWSRVAAGALLCLFVGIIFFAGHMATGFFMNWGGQQGGEGFEYHLLVLGICVAIIFLGSGRLSVDRALTK